jgi:hypothetical protein
VPDDTSTVWVDSSFIEPTPSLEDVAVEFYPASAENIGSYSMPVVFTLSDTTDAKANVLLSYFQSTAISGTDTVAAEYYSYPLPLIDDVYISLVEFLSGSTTLSGVVRTPTSYTTGYNTVSGVLDNKFSFIGGDEYPTSLNYLHSFTNSSTISGVIEWWVNHTNFSGNLEDDDTPIPFHTSDFSYEAYYFQKLYHDNLGAINKFVDISFAGWVSFLLNSDVYSTLLGFKLGYDCEVTTISGGLWPHYLDAFSCLLTTSGISCDAYCSLVDYDRINSEITTISGRIGYIETDVYSTIEEENYLGINVDLYSLKLSNFSLGVGEFTTASGFISIDVTDDECPVSTSGTYFMVDDVRVPVTFSGITDGYRMFYDPTDDFISLTGPKAFTAHAENECGDYLEQDFYLTFGYIVEYINRPELSSGMDYGFDHKVAVRVTAENYASCPRLDSLAWEFESKNQFNNDLGASIVGRFHAFDERNISAEIYPQSTAYFYGKEFTVTVNAKDFAGNEMTPLVLTYKIENKP